MQRKRSRSCTENAEDGHNNEEIIEWFYSAIDPGDQEKWCYCSNDGRTDPRVQLLHSARTQQAVVGGAGTATVSGESKLFDHAGPLAKVTVQGVSGRSRISQPGSPELKSSGEKFVPREREVCEWSWKSFTTWCP
ncbi:hypothetical protein CEXT_98051 [Caerostris extrusa]|uniref:Uncharacterized protein n=1 Tax=Caerostris extrusa TaxID=172846 RepID=A0AAV4U8X4_CAEEX|nr:hypothetical protein CEXT_98051 [Caerostris extrusa]